MNRRAFLTTTGLTFTAAARLSAGQSTTPPTLQDTDSTNREQWLAYLERLADPVLTNLAAGTLKARMPVEEVAGANRQAVTHLEAFGRLMAGIAPWLDAEATGDEAAMQSRYRDLAYRALAQALDPTSPDALNFTIGGQPLVDAAFLAEAVLRAPRTLQQELPAATRERLIAAFESARVIQPGFNNWLLFAATVEAALKMLGAGWDRMRVDYAVRQHDQWYVGDGAYRDGPAFHWDYYNSFVIHPMLVDVLAACGDEHPAWKAICERQQNRARRYAAVQERMVAPDGSFPPIGRSIAYRCGAFQALAQAALWRQLPEEVPPAQAREALSAVIRRSLDAPGTFDADGWLTIGLAGHQPNVGERYISTGSLYLCATALLPLGLPAPDPFWADPPRAWTSKRAWAGEEFPIDKALSG